ncbi:fimbrial protein [Pantoea ananatis]|uniref:fimbrial protein n=1 Tax=Pantoea ananas TaxID=553 RepID=UPI0007DADB9A|nr:fimbrial protein [Pantoea ananatis]MCW0313683.1 Type-1 fimbrial protein, A chain [Pantoea ananatis]MCW0332455.1 Type-1 fimbrial protein, A chain [Pantoea ananatis]UYL02103.1 fimbrial protein [Pantoea ananatis]
MKNKFLISSIAMLFLGMNTLSHAATVEGGTINFLGEVVNTACVVSSDTAYQTVQLGQVKASTFGDTAGTKAQNPKAFKIILEQCDGTSSTAAITFSGVKDPNRNALKSSGTAAGVGVYLVDNNNAEITLGTATSAQALSGSTNIYTFKADMISISDTVTVGTVDSSADFTVTYA